MNKKISIIKKLSFIRPEPRQCYGAAVLEYEGPVYRPPSEANSLIVQATIGCSWNHCTYCAMYRHKAYRERPLEDVLKEVELVAQNSDVQGVNAVRRVFVADGDALGMPMGHWTALLSAIKQKLPRVGRVSCYATARNLLEKSEGELLELKELGLSMLYIGPESGDDKTLKSIAKGASFEQHVEAARRARSAKIHQSLIFLLGAAGTERSTEHALGAARLTTEMDPRYVSLLTVTVLPDTPLATLQKKGKFTVPPPKELLHEIALFIGETNPTNAVFRSNHASNYLPLSGRLSRDRDRLLKEVQSALVGEVALRPEWSRRL